MKEILVGVDGSPESRKATDLAVEIARAIGARIELACVIPPPAVQGPELQDPSEWERAEREYACTVLRELSGRCIEAGIQVDEVMPSGRPAETLARMAGASPVSMVVVGHRGRNAVARVLMGSVADELAQTSPKPVLIVR